jgi:hypothetical protein
MHAIGAHLRVLQSSVQAAHSVSKSEDAPFQFLRFCSIPGIPCIIATRLCNHQHRWHAHLELNPSNPASGLRRARLYDGMGAAQIDRRQHVVWRNSQFERLSEYGLSLQIPASVQVVSLRDARRHMPDIRSVEDELVVVREV